MKRLIDLYPYRMKGSEPVFFIAKRSGSKVYSGQWRMIGGKVKKGETAWQAALRELKEESGLKPARFWCVPSLNQFYEPGTDSICLIPAFAALIPDDAEVKLDDEHSEFKWVTIDQVLHYIHWPEQERLMKLIRHILSSQDILEDWEIPVK